MHRIVATRLLAILIGGCAGQRKSVIVADAHSVRVCRFAGTFSDRKLDSPLIGGNRPHVARNSA